MTGKNTAPLFYWDTCIFFHAINRKSPDTAFLDELDKLLKRFNDREIVLCTSAIVHIEFSAERLKKYPKKYAFLANLYGTIEIINANSRVIKRAAEIKDYYAPKGITITTPDAIHLASAIYVEASEFHTTDGGGQAGTSKGKLLALTSPIAGKYPLDIKTPRAAQPNLGLSGAIKGLAQGGTTSN